LDKEKNILRQNHLTGYVRRENDAEHAWHMAIMVYLLKEYANKDFDIAKAMMMALIHDVVEIDAGDTYAYDPKAKLDQKEREDKAAQRIFALLPPDQCEELKALFYEFEACESAEAKFVRAMDNFQPLLLNDANDGVDWKNHGVTLEQIMNRQMRSAKGSQKVWEETEKIIQKNVAKQNIIKE
jgi:putative hydrolase of HD superfamily